MSATTTTAVTTSASRDVDMVTRLVGDDHLTSAAITVGALLTPHEPVQSSSRTTTSNPEWWPTQHRRIPNYRRARYHPQWDTLTDGNREAFMINMMFRGCYLLSVVDWIPRVFGYDTSYFTYRVAGEW